MFDSHDRDRLESQTKDLKKLLKAEELQDIILLVFANKQDLPDAMRKEEIEEKMELRELNNTWYVQPCSVIEGEGLYEGLEWLASAIKNKYE